MKQAATIMWALVALSGLAGLGALSYTAGYTAATADAIKVSAPTLPPQDQAMRDGRLPPARFTVTPDGAGRLRVRDGAGGREWVVPIPPEGADGVGQDRH